MHQVQTDELVGQTLAQGEYRLVARLGSGAMGAVYEAEQANLRRRVAVKVLWPHLGQEPGLVDRFNREARIAARLEHPHILPVFGFGHERGLLYLVMRLVRGGSLKDRLRGEGTVRQGWPPREALELARQTLPPLDFAHRQGVVHRDLKPDNILLEPSDDFPSGYRAFLSDFSIARLIQSEDVELGLTQAGDALGTPTYMAPEQVLEQDVDGRADLYAFGVVLYELLVGRVPFQGHTPLGVAMQHVREAVPRPRELNPAISPALEAVLLRALAKDRDERFATGAALVAALSEAVQSASTRIPSTIMPVDHHGGLVDPAPGPAVERSPAGEQLTGAYVREAAPAETQAAESGAHGLTAAKPQPRQTPTEMSPTDAQGEEPPRAEAPLQSPPLTEGPAQPQAEAPAQLRAEAPSLPPSAAPAIAAARPPIGPPPHVDSMAVRTDPRTRAALRARSGNRLWSILVLCAMLALSALAIGVVWSALRPALPGQQEAQPSATSPASSATQPASGVPAAARGLTVTSAELGPGWQLSTESTAGSTAGLSVYEVEYAQQDGEGPRTTGFSVFAADNPAAAEAGFQQLRESAEARGVAFESPSGSDGDRQLSLRGRSLLADDPTMLSIVHLFRLNNVVAIAEVIGPADQEARVQAAAERAADLQRARLMTSVTR